MSQPADEKVVLAQLTETEALMFQRVFSRKFALKDALKSITEALAEEQVKEDELWSAARRQYGITEGYIHINCAERKIYAGFGGGGAV